MRRLFPGQQSRTPEELKVLWEDCLFAFDASALLDLYRVTADTRDRVYAILDALQERIWLPYQAGREFYENREEVIRTGVSSYTKIPEAARTACADFKKVIAKRYARYQWVDTEKWAKILADSAEHIEKELKRSPQELSGFETDDPVEKRLTDLFGAHVGKPALDIGAIFEEGEKRFALKVPPGYEDERKGTYRQFGDLILWFELIEHAKSEKRPVVLITSDAKSDWWLERDNKTIGPRPELLEEMQAKAGVEFHIYRLHQFIEHAQSNLRLPRPSASRKAAEEVKELEKYPKPQSIPQGFVWATSDGVGFLERPPIPARANISFPYAPLGSSEPSNLFFDRPLNQAPLGAPFSPTLKFLSRDGVIISSQEPFGMTSVVPAYEPVSSQPSAASLPIKGFRTPRKKRAFAGRRTRRLLNNPADPDKKGE